MNRTFNHLQEETARLLQEALNEPHPISRYLDCIRILESAVLQMKEMVLDNPFMSKEDEIHHFKHEAPEIYSQLFYYLELDRIESARPYSDPEAFLGLLRRKKAYIDEFFNSHETICRYYSQGMTHYDDHLFIRPLVGQWSGEEIGTFIPPDFTIGTNWVSWIKAFDRLRNWIRQEQDGGHDPAPTKRRIKLRWTGTRADLILLICALYLAHCFNDGKITLKDLMAWAKEEFGVNLNQFHVALGEMSIRKDPVKFFRRLIDLITQKFDSLLQ